MTASCGIYALLFPFRGQKIFQSKGFKKMPLGVLKNPHREYAPDSGRTALYLLFISLGVHVGLRWKKRLCGREKSLKPLPLSGRAFCRRGDWGLPRDLWESQLRARGAGVRAGRRQPAEAVGSSPCLPAFACHDPGEKPFETVRGTARNHTKHASQTQVAGEEPGGRLRTPPWRWRFSLLNRGLEAGKWPLNLDQAPPHKSSASRSCPSWISAPLVGQI